MLSFLNDIGGIGLLAIGALGLLFFFQWLLIRETLREKRNQSERLRQLEVLVQQEIARSQKALSQVKNLDTLKTETEEKLGLIRVLLEMMQKDSKKDP
ncbi:hypothetical protein [Algoriphagus confluentis]|uniref:Uncharacterized protein n=1 Tax=Algoriphagus confluentis TaxID=1697556 RepID=A0ABQ6PJ53_9BACT|nr:hypothetical protein Aconfl_06370 [Algoriphagus confluentis]